MDKLKVYWTKFLGLKKWQKVVVVVLILSLGSVLFSDTETDTPVTITEKVEPAPKTINRSYPVEYVRSFAVNPATLTVVFNILNDGTQPVKPSCDIRMEDASGTYRGFDVFDLIDAVPANGTKQVVVQLTITKEGAEFADQFTGKCTAETTDSGTLEGQGVKISEIRNFSATEGSEGWYWGASFKSDQPLATMMNCEVNALDGTGKVIGTTKFRGKAGNDGTVGAYGPNEGEKFLVDSTKSMVLSIKSFDVKCTL